MYRYEHGTTNEIGGYEVWSDLFARFRDVSGWEDGVALEGDFQGVETSRRRKVVFMKKIYQMLVQVMGMDKVREIPPQSSLAENLMRGEQPVVYSERAMAMIDAGVAP